MNKLKEYILNNINNKFVVVANDAINEKIVSCFSKQIINITFKNKETFCNEINGYFTLNGYLALANDANIPYEVAKKKLDSSVLVYKKTPINDKTKEIINLYEKYQKYYSFDDILFSFYFGKDIIIVDYFDDDDLLNLTINKISAYANIVRINVNQKVSNNTIKLYRYDALKDEVFSLVKDIAKLLNENISPNNIKVLLLSSDYYGTLKEAFDLYDIDTSLKSDKYLYSLKTVREIYNELSLKKNSYLKDVKIMMTLSSNSLTAFNSVLKKYLLIDEKIGYFLDALLYDLKNTLISPIKKENIITFIDLFDEVFTEDDYLFIIGASQGSFPVIHKDEDYLLDYEREYFGLLSSTSKNLSERKKVNYLLESLRNIKISYSLRSRSNEYVKSSYLDSLNDLIKEEKGVLETNTISYSFDNEILSYRKHLDLYYKYGIKSDGLYLYHYNHKNNLKDFDNQYQVFQSQVYPLNLKLSYTSLNEFFECPFKFYVRRILKIYEPVTKNNIFLGNLMHYCLCALLKEDFSDVSEFLKDKIKEFYRLSNREISAKDEFFNSIYQEVLIEKYSFFKLMDEVSMFKVKSLEESFEVILNKEQNITLEGKIDKVLTCVIDDKEYAIVIDYKTSSTEFDINNVFYGLDMQIFIYFYLLMKCKDYQFAGGYLDAILPKKPFIANEEEEKQKLVGYTLDEAKVLESIDTKKEELLHGIRYKTDGTLYEKSKSRVISNEDFQKLEAIVEENIAKAIDKITKNEFFIAPIKINERNSCKYCKYKAICNVERREFVEKEKLTNLEFLRGATDGK